MKAAQKNIFLLIEVLLVPMILGQNGLPPPPMPIPLPDLNLQTANGSWYVNMYYAYEGAFGSITCMTFDFNVQGNTILTTQTTYTNDNPQTINTNYTTGIQKSIWGDGSDNEIRWLYIDPITYSYAVLGYTSTQNAFLLSKSQNIPGILNAQALTLLASQSYLVDNSSVLLLTNPCNL